jgi:hypothetical protein
MTEATEDTRFDETDILDDEALDRTASRAACVIPTGLCVS